MKITLSSLLSLLSLTSLSMLWESRRILSNNHQQLEQEQQLRGFDWNTFHLHGHNLPESSYASNDPTSNNSTIKTISPVHFLTCESMRQPYTAPNSSSGFYGGCFSGMWWGTRKVAESLHPPKIMYASATYAAYNKVGRPNITLTQDWMDFSVEHLSAFVKMLPQTRETKAIYTSILQSYIKRASASRFSITEVANSTLAMLPIFVSDKHLNDTESLEMYSLAATVVSIWRLGIPRVVIAGNTESEPVMLRETRALVPASIEIAYVHYPVEKNNKGLILGPVLAVRRMKLALTGKLDSNEQQKWFGENSLSWKYIYFSEPDLPVFTRQSSLAALGFQLKQNKLLVAHRLQPVAHEIDFPAPELLNNTVPKSGTLGELQDLTFLDSCCDAGNYFPGIEGIKHPQFWYDIGFRPFEMRKNRKRLSDLQAVQSRNERLMSYPMIRLNDGLRVPLVNQHARLCIPVNGGRCGKAPLAID